MSVIRFRNCVAWLSAGVGMVFSGLGAHAQAPTQSVNPILPTPKPPAAFDARMAEANANFVENKGQWGSEPRFLARIPGLDYWMTRTGFTLDSYEYKNVDGVDKREGVVVKVEFADANESAKPAGVDKVARKIDFINPRGTFQGVGAFGEAFLKNVYSNIDFRSYLDKKMVRYDFIVKPGGNPSQIKLNFEGNTGVEVDASGNLTIQTVRGPIRQTGLFAYQGSGNSKRRVSAKFVKLGENRVGFALGSYDKSQTLTIDPLVYGTYLGGDALFASQDVRGVASDNNSTVYITGSTTAADFPITAGPYGYNWRANHDAFVVALQGDAYAITYSAFIGGWGDDIAKYAGVDQYGDLWISGTTTSYNLTGAFSNAIHKASSGDPNPTNGNFTISYKGATTANLAFNASAATIATALNGLPTAPAGGFTTTGGPLPNNEVKVSTVNPVDGGITVNSTSRIAVAFVAGVAPYQQEWDFSWDALGFRPVGGTFKIRVLFNNIIFTTDPIPFNATPDQIVAALVGLGFSCNITPLQAGGSTLVDPGGANLPTGTAAVFLSQSVQGMGVDSTGLKTVYSADRQVPAAFLMRLEKSATDVLDPVTRQYIQIFEGTNGLVGFGIKPVATPSGSVEVAMFGGVDGSVTGIPGTAGPGYILDLQIPKGSVVPNINTTKSQYVTGTAVSGLTGGTIDASGSIYVVGSVAVSGNVLTNASSTTFATTSGVFSGGNLIKSGDAFVRKYNNSGGVQFSAVLGGIGNDTGLAIASDASGNSYVISRSKSFNFPRTVGTFGQVFTAGSQLAATKISPDGSQILYSTGLGTTGDFIEVTGAAVDSRGNLYLGGGVGFRDPTVCPGPTIPSSVPVTPFGPAIIGQEAAIDNTYTGGNLNAPRVVNPIAAVVSSLEGFVYVIDPTATGVLFSTYIGGNTSNDHVYGISLDKSNSLWVAGVTTMEAINDRSLHSESNQSPYLNGLATAGLPAGFITPLAFKANPNGSGDGFLFKYRVNLPTLNTLLLTPTTAAGGLGAFIDGAVSIKAPAPAGGQQVTVRVLNPTIGRFDRVGGPISKRLTIPAGQTTVGFTIFTNAVTTPTALDVRAEMDGDFLVSRATVKPWLDTFTIDADEVTGGDSVHGTVGLIQAALASGVDFTFSTDRPDLVTVTPSTQNIPSGQQSQIFDIQTSGVATETTVNLTVTVQGVGLSTSLKLLPAQPSSISFDPARVNGGESSTGTIQFDGIVVAGTTITLTSTGAPVTLGTATIAADGRSATFKVDTFAATAGDTSATIRASVNGGSVLGTLLIDQVDITGVTINAPLLGGVKSALGGTNLTGVVQLNKPASASGLNILLVSDNPAVGIAVGKKADGSAYPNHVYIAPGATSATFDLATSVVASPQGLTISTGSPGYASKADFVVVRPLDYSISLTPTTVIGGLGSSAGTITLLGGEVAPASGLTVTLTSSNTGAATINPSTVTIPAGGTTANFTVTSKVVQSDTNVTVTATINGGVTKSAVLLVKAQQLVKFIVTPSTVSGGTTTTATVGIDSNAPAGGVVVLISSADPSVVGVPSQVTIPAGSNEVTFSVTTTPVASQRNITLTATKGTSQLQALVTVTVANAKTLSFNPESVVGGSNSTGTITIDQPAPAGGLVILLSSNQPSFVNHPTSVTIPAGQKTATFTVGTTQVSRPIGVTFTATVQSTGQAITGVLFIDRNPG